MRKSQAKDSVLKRGFRKSKPTRSGKHVTTARRPKKARNFLRFLSFFSIRLISSRPTLFDFGSNLAFVCRFISEICAIGVALVTWERVYVSFSV
jgi:hypothetical protein